jgi:hypothetical protein
MIKAELVVTQGESLSPGFTVFPAVPSRGDVVVHSGRGYTIVGLNWTIHPEGEASLTLTLSPIGG